MTLGRGVVVVAAFLMFWELMTRAAWMPGSSGNALGAWAAQHPNWLLPRIAASSPWPLLPMSNEERRITLDRFGLTNTPALPLTFTRDVLPRLIVGAQTGKERNLELLWPVHVLLSTGLVWVTARIGWPRHRLSRVELGSAACRAAFFGGACAVALLILDAALPAYWAARRSLGAWGPPGSPITPIDMHAGTIAVISYGAAIGYVAMMLSIVRAAIERTLRNRPVTHNLMGNRCSCCGYHASAERPCPECGLENPLALRRVYFGRWHARLMLSRWRWVAALPWVAVVVLFFWPLISGLARHWLG
jgi:hypothetical protein